MTKELEIMQFLRERVFAPALVVAVLLTSFLVYYLGWIYEVNWYGYFGLDAAQLRLPPSLIVDQGIILFSVNLGLLLLVFTTVFALQVLTRFAWNLLFSRIPLRLSDLFSLERFFKHNFHTTLLLYIVFSYWLMWLYWTYDGQTVGKQPIPALAGNISELLVFFIFPLVVLLLFCASADLLMKLPGTLKRLLKLEPESEIVNGKYRAWLGALAILATFVFWAGILGIVSGSLGAQMNGAYSKDTRVNLISDHEIVGLESFRIGCGCNPYPYTYGPLQYLAETDDYLILTLVAEGQSRFTKSPPLYRIQRSQEHPINIVSVP